MKIVLFGGSGTLGTLLKEYPNVLSPTHAEVDITDFSVLNTYLDQNSPDIVINAAAVIDNRLIERDSRSAIRTNIIGSANIAEACIAHKIRLVYISTDYVYKGDRGNYRETDEILPFNAYSWTKLGGECSAVCVENHLIIRTSFGKETFDYPEAFTDKWTSKDYVDKIAPIIMEAALSPVSGVLNVGTHRKSIYEHAISRNSNVKPVRIDDTAFSTPRDTSMNLQKLMDMESTKPDAKARTTCRICEGNLVKYLDLGLMPLPNNLAVTADLARKKERYPLQVMFCKHCQLSQLSTVIDPEKMFSYYTYRSSVNGGYVRHCKKMAESLISEGYMKHDDFVIDIAGNDGTLLKEFLKVDPTLRVLNVDPASNLTAIAESNGIRSVSDFWNEEFATQLVKHVGKANLITATNVFAHVDDVRGFLKGVKKALDIDGTLVLEFPYLRDLLINCEFDTVYFEHLSYFGIYPISHLCYDIGLEVHRVEHQEIHGGTVRVMIKHPGKEVHPSVEEYIHAELEDDMDDIEKYKSWSNDVNDTIEKFANGIMDLKRAGYKIAAFAASAKGNTLLNSARMTTDHIRYIADETPEKIGKFSPGTGIPIVNKQTISSDPPDYIVILSWNFKEEIMEKLRPIYNGKFIIPIPTFEIVE